MGAAILWNVLPDLVFPQANGNSYLGDWGRMYLSFAGKSAPGVWHSDLLLNQSLGGTLNRWCRLALGIPVLDAHMSGRELPGGAIVWLKRGTYAAALLLLAVTAFRGGRFFQRLPKRDSKAAGEPGWNQLQHGLEVSAILCLMLLLSPMSGKAHFVILLLPCLLIAKRVIERPGIVELALLGVLMLCGPVGSKSLLGGSVGQQFLIWGTPTIFVLVNLMFMWRLIGASPKVVTEDVPLVATPPQKVPEAMVA